MSLQVIRGLENYTAPTDRGVVVTIGTFDGIHLGHQEILKQVAVATGESGYHPVLITFHPHPRVLVTPDDAPLLLTTLEEKERSLRQYFQGTMLVLDFNADLQNLSAREFVEKVLVNRLELKRLVVGYDHAFGKDRSGSIVELKELGKEFEFEVDVVAPVKVDGDCVSSTQIRWLLRRGMLDRALELLGHPLAIHGIVEKGIGLGRKLGYPTANVRYGPRKLLPTQGVYSCRVHVGHVKREGMLFIGRNHFNPEARITVETNLFDFNEDIYARELYVYPTHYIRPNRKFDSTDALVEQIKQDKREVLSIIEKEKRNVSDQRAESSNYL